MMSKSKYKKELARLVEARKWSDAVELVNSWGRSPGAGVMGAMADLLRVSADAVADGYTGPGLMLPSKKNGGL